MRQSKWNGSLRGEGAWMTYCTQCGTPASSGRFCVTCGALIEWPDAADSTTPSPAPKSAGAHPESAPTPRKIPEPTSAPAPEATPGGPTPRRRPSLILLAAVGIAVLAVAGTAIWFLTRSSGPDQAAAASPAAATVAESEEIPSTLPSPIQSSAAASPVPTEPEPTSEPSLAADPVAALTLSEDEAATQLADMQAQDRPTVRALGGEWVVQLSGKCAGLTKGDFGPDPDSVGWPDGVEEDFPDGIGSNRVLAYHLVMQEQFGQDVVLAALGDVGQQKTVDACEGTPFYVSLLSSTNFQTADEALAWCDEVGLPQYECAARPIDVPGASGVESR